MITTGAVLGALLTLAAASAADTAPGDCQKLGARYRAAVAGVTDTLRAYEKCVAESLRPADCAGELGELEISAGSI